MLSVTIALTVATLHLTKEDPTLLHLRVKM